MKRIKNFLNELLNRIQGAFFGIISSIIAGLGDIIALTFFPGYCILNNMVSDLGITEGGGIFFNLGLILSGIIAIPFYYSLSLNFLKENILIRKYALITSIISCITFSLIGVFPAYRENFLSLYLHGTFATISWISGALYCFLFGILMYQNELYSNYLAYYSFFCSILFVLSLLTWIPLLEWILSFGIFGFVIINSLYTFCLKKNK